MTNLTFTLDISNLGGKSGRHRGRSGRYRGISGDLGGISGGLSRISGGFREEHRDISGGYRGNLEDISRNFWNLGGISGDDTAKTRAICCNKDCKYSILGFLRGFYSRVRGKLLIFWMTVGMKM